MTLLDRYLHAVRFFLPGNQQDDIVRELSENIGSEVDERAGALGRELTEAEIADILRRHGHPMVVAARFGPRHQLIGPAIFPFYAFALKVGLGVSLVVSAVLAIIEAALRGDVGARLGEGLLAYPGRALVVFAWTTLVFAVLDLAGSRATFATDWDPRRIPEWMVTVPHRPRFQSALEALFGALALVWFLLVPTSPWLALGPLASVLQFAPIWRAWYLPLVFLTVTTLAIDLWRAARPGHSASPIRARIGANALQLLVVLAVLSAGEWVVLRLGVVSSDGRDVVALTHLVNASFRIGLAVVAVITVVEIGKQWYRLRTSHVDPALSESSAGRRLP